MEDDRYGLQPELRRPAPCFPAIPQVPSLVPPFFFPRSLNPAGTSLRQPPPSSGHFGPAIHHHIFPNTANGHCSSPSSLGAGFSTAGDGPPHRTATLSSGAAAVGDGGRQMEIGGGGSRWPRQETLTLLEIRCRLDSKFKGAIHKGPLWDEVSRYVISITWRIPSTK
ncbi:hypothetical protein SAY87_006938 [Trapa incisa]|uniref:Uncharacterized protein n=1 Tax=Trapa incisa TaxID=236973 RepID=A0AAN7PZP1_9MYRT|nr:hypothetical protein SAY87_006938 [Trapa incisa]